MIDQTPLRFGLGRMLLAVATAAVILGGSTLLYRWWTAKPTIPLANAVAQFNQFATSNRVGTLEPPLTDAEVISSIQIQLSEIPGTLGKGTFDIHDIFERIAKTQRLPRDARLYAISDYQSADAPPRPVWWINLDVPLGNDVGYKLRIRETNDPVVDKKMP
jgi:hypothetical protein